MLLLHSGTILIISDHNNPSRISSLNISRKDDSNDFDNLKESAYDKFHITLSNIQVLFIYSGDDWRKIPTLPSCRNHILKPFGLDVTIKKCIITNDANLPK